MSLFLKSRNILLYHSLPDEVQTASFIEKWYKEKNIFLPVVEGNDLTIKKFEPKNLIKGSFNILEPQGDPINDLAIIDLAIIPGVAFDRKCNRLGRGKGFYDRLLKNLKCKKIGIAFTFQIIDSVPVDEFDVPLDGIVSEKEIII